LMKIMSFFYYKKNENLIPVALPSFRYKEKINKNIKILIYIFLDESTEEEIKYRVQIIK